jgi:hypothetical protein
MVGTTIAHYRVLELLGRGGMGEVYAADDLRLRRKVALKVLPPAMAASAERRRRFEREAQAIAALNHPGIVTIHSVEHVDGIAFLTMELVEGKTLAESVPAGGLSLQEFMRIAIPLADAVNAAHERGIMHRDLKPGNVMVTRDGRVKVLDFGLAKLTERSAYTQEGTAPVGAVTTTAGQIVGTVSYMAPEQAEGKPSDHRVDIFALGVMLYELAVGVRPFAGDTTVSILTSVMRDTPRSVTDLRSDLPAALDAILQRCVEKDPERRYGSAAELRKDLETLRDALSPRGFHAPAPPWAYAASAAIVMLIGFTGWRIVNVEALPQTAARPAVLRESKAVPVLITGRQVAILDFENRTGDPALDVFGRKATEAIAAAVVAEGLPVVPAITASAADGITVGGSYSIERDQLRFDGRLLSASRGTVVRVIDPVFVPRSDVGLVVGADEAKRGILSGIRATLAPQTATR